MESAMALTHSEVDSDDEEQLLFDPLLDLTQCSDFDNESILYSESLLLGDDDTNKEFPAVKVKIEKEEEIRVPISRRESGNKNQKHEETRVRRESGNKNSQTDEEIRVPISGRETGNKDSEPRSSNKHTEITKPIRSTIIKLNNAKKFRYVPEALPSVELPLLARKRKRLASTTCIVGDIEPTLLLQPKRRNTDNSRDLRPKIQQNREAQMYRQLFDSAPSVSNSNGIPSVYPAVRETHPEICTTLEKEEHPSSSSSPHVPSPRKSLITSPTAISTSGLGFRLSTHKQLRKEEHPSSSSSHVPSPRKSLITSPTAISTSGLGFRLSTHKQLRKEEHPSSSSSHVPSPRKSLITSPTVISTSGLGSRLSTHKQLRKLTSCSEALRVDVTSIGKDYTSGISSLGRATVFATRPGLINRNNPAKFSLQHLGAQNTLKFSLDHL